MESQTAQQVPSPVRQRLAMASTLRRKTDHVVQYYHVTARSDRAIQLTINVKQIQKLDKY